MTDDFLLGVLAGMLLSASPPEPFWPNEWPYIRNLTEEEQKDFWLKIQRGDYENYVWNK